jgi:Sec-independent protein translocase protein TatA
MEIFDIGPMEFILIIIIALVVLGPDQMIVTARKIGEGIRKIVKSPVWTSLMDSTREIQTIKTKIVKETGLDETMKEIRDAQSQIPTISFDPKNALNVDLNLPKLSDIKNSPEPAEKGAAAAAAVPETTEKASPAADSTPATDASEAADPAVPQETEPAATPPAETAAQVETPSAEVVTPAADEPKTN